MKRKSRRYFDFYIDLFDFIIDFIYIYIYSICVALMRHIWTHVLLKSFISYEKEVFYEKQEISLF